MLKGRFSQRRRAQNRASQRAFRERKEKHVQQLEQQLSDLESKYEHLTQSYTDLGSAHQKLKREVKHLRSELEILYLKDAPANELGNSSLFDSIASEALFDTAPEGRFWMMNVSFVIALCQPSFFDWLSACPKTCTTNYNGGLTCSWQAVNLAIVDILLLGCARCMISGIEAPSCWALGIHEDFGRTGKDLRRKRRYRAIIDPFWPIASQTPFHVQHQRETEFRGSLSKRNRDYARSIIFRKQSSRQPRRKERHKYNNWYDAIHTNRQSSRVVGDDRKRTVWESGNKSKTLTDWRHSLLHCRSSHSSSECLLLLLYFHHFALLDWSLSCWLRVSRSRSHF